MLCLCATLGLSGVAAAVSEEPISSSATRPAHPVIPGPSSVATPENAPAPIESAAEPAMPSTYTSPHPAQPRAVFPYFIRSGDTWGSIATMFGVSVADLTRLNRATEDSELIAGHPIRIPNPSVMRERELTAQVDQLTHDQQDAEARARQAVLASTTARGRVDELTVQVRQASHDLHALAWWRGTAYLIALVATLLLGATAVALVDWWFLRSRFRAVAEMNEALRRLDYRYKSALAKAELRLQELYGRRRRGLHDGQERPRLAEEAEIEALNRELKAVLDHHLRRLGPARGIARRARWQARIGGIGSPVEPRAIRR